jgi:hypothetical protein
MKRRTTLAEAGVPCIFDDACTERLSKVGKLSWAANLKRFGMSLCASAAAYVREAAVVSGNDVNREITKLYRAAVRPKRKYNLVHDLVKGLSAEAKVFLKKRPVPPSLGWRIPDDPDILLDPATQDEACDGIVRLIQTGGKWKRGRKRPKKGRKRQSGVRSWTFEPLLYAPPLRTHPPKRSPELNLVMNLRLAHLEATGMLPPLAVRHVTPTRRLLKTAHPRKRLPPFAQMAKECLVLVGRPDVDVVEMINKLQRQRNAKLKKPAQNKGKKGKRIARRLSPRKP